MIGKGLGDPFIFSNSCSHIEVLAKLAPKFILKLRAFEAPVAKAVDFDTALLAVLANEVPFVIDFENTLESDFPIVLALLAFTPTEVLPETRLPFNSIFYTLIETSPTVSVVELLVSLVLVVPSVLLFDSVSVIPSVSVCPLVSVTDEFVPSLCSGTGTDINANCCC